MTEAFAQDIAVEELALEVGGRVQEGQQDILPEERVDSRAWEAGLEGHRDPHTEVVAEEGNHGSGRRPEQEVVPNYLRSARLSS